MNKAELIVLRNDLVKKHFKTVNEEISIVSWFDIQRAINDSTVTIWQLLLDLIVFFLENYFTNSKLSFSIWNFKKNFRMVVKLWQFFNRLYEFFKKNH